MSIHLRRLMIPLMIGLVFLVALEAQASEEPVVRAIVVRGNQYIDTAQIQAAILKTTLDEVAVEQHIIDDMHTIYDLGYFYDVRASFESAPGGVRVVFEVEEYPVVTGIIFKGAHSVPVHEYVGRMRVKVGDVLNVNHITEDVRKLPEWVLQEYGISVIPVDLRADDFGLVEIELAETIVTEIRIEGNVKTKDFVISRELTLKEGDVLNLNELNRSLRRILMLGFFEEVGRAFVDGDKAHETILVIQVKERKTGTGSAAIGYSTQDGVIGILEVSEENFLGRAQSIKAHLEIGRNHRVYEVGFFEPYIDSRGTSFGTNLYRRDSSVTKRLEDLEDPLEGSRVVVGGDVSVGRRFTDDTTARITLKAQNISYTIEKEQEEHADQFFKDYNTRTIGLGLATNTTDHPLYPSLGYKNSVNLEVGTTLLGGSSQFSKVQVEHSRFLQVRGGGYVFAVRGMGGRVLTGRLEENELFRIGGSDSLRGYQRGDAGLTGDKVLLFNAEFRFPIVERVQGVVFTDWGRAWDEKETMNITDLRHSYGLGVRLDTPLGLMRFDYGWPQSGTDRKGSFVFGLGQTF